MFENRKLYSKVVMTSRRLIQTRPPRHDRTDTQGRNACSRSLREEVEKQEHGLICDNERSFTWWMELNQLWFWRTDEFQCPNMLSVSYTGARTLMRPTDSMSDNWISIFRYEVNKSIHNPRWKTNHFNWQSIEWLRIGGWLFFHSLI